MLKHKIGSAVYLILFLSISAGAQNLLSLPESVVYDSLHYRYLASNYNTGHIVAIDTAGNQSYFVTSQYCKNGLHIAGNTVYAACVDSGVKGFDLETGQLTMHVMPPGGGNMNDITSDNSGHLYVSNPFGNTIYKIRLSDQSCWVYWDSGDFSPNGLHYDAAHHRLLIACYLQAAPIMAIDLEDSTLSTVTTSSASLLDGITQDQYGNTYFTAWGTTAVYRFDSTFASPPMLFFINAGGPADLSYSPANGTLAIPIMNYSTLIFIPMLGGSLFIEGYEVTDDSNGDGRADPGETCELVINVQSASWGLPVYDATGVLSCMDSSVVLEDSSAYYGAILPGSSTANSSDPFIFSVNPTEPHWATFTLLLQFMGQSIEMSLQIELGRPPVLLVDDDGLGFFENFYFASFDSMDLFVDYWSQFQNMISPEELQRYSMVLWETGNETQTLNDLEQAAIAGYCETGGQLLLSSKNVGADIGTTAFYTNYLRAQFLADTIPAVSRAYGADNCPFIQATDTLWFVGGAGNYGSLDGISPIWPAATAFHYNNAAATIGGIYYDGPYQLIYLAFPLESVSGILNSVPRHQVIQQIFDWFEFTGIRAHGEAPENYHLRIEPIFPNPFNATAAISFELRDPGFVILSVYDISGRRLNAAINGWRQAGRHKITFDGSELSSGLYIYRLEAGEHSAAGKMVLLK